MACDARGLHFLPDARGLVKKLSDGVTRRYIYSAQHWALEHQLCHLPPRIPRTFGGVAYSVWSSPTPAGWRRIAAAAAEQAREQSVPYFLLRHWRGVVSRSFVDDRSQEAIHWDRLNLGREKQLLVPDTRYESTDSDSGFDAEPIVTDPLEIALKAAPDVPWSDDDAFQRELFLGRYEFLFDIPWRKDLLVAGVETLLSAVEREKEPWNRALLERWVERLRAKRLKRWKASQDATTARRAEPVFKGPLPRGAMAKWLRAWPARKPIERGGGGRRPNGDCVFRDGELTLNFDRVLNLRTRVMCWCHGLDKVPGVGVNNSHDLPLIASGVDPKAKAGLREFVRCVPPELTKTVARYESYQLTMLRLAKHCYGAAELLVDAPNLVWMVARFVRKREVGLRELSDLFTRSRLEVLQWCFGPECSRESLRFLLKVRPLKGSVAESAFLARVVVDDELARWFRHAPEIAFWSIREALDHRGPWQREFFREPMMRQSCEDVAEAVALFDDTVEASRALIHRGQDFNSARCVTLTGYACCISESSLRSSMTRRSAPRSRASGPNTARSSSRRARSRAPRRLFKSPTPRRCWRRAPRCVIASEASRAAPATGRTHFTVSSSPSARRSL